MEIDRRTFLSLAALGSTFAGGIGLGMPGAAFGAVPQIRTMRASLGSSVLGSAVCFFWIGMHPKLNYYLEEGLIAQWRGVQNQTQALGLIVSKAQEVGGVGPSTLMGLAAKGTKVPLKVAFAHYQKNPWRTVVAADSGIKTWADLKGKKVGLINLGQLSTKWYIEAAVREAGLDPKKDISFVPVGVNAPAGIALKNGNADAYISFTIHIARLQRLGFKVRLMPDPPFAGAHSFDGGMTVNDAFLDDADGRKALTGFFRAVAKGCVFSLQNPEMAQRLHYDMFPAALPKGVPYDKAIEASTMEFKKNLENITVGEDPFKQQFGMMSKKKWETVAYTIMQLSHKQIPDVGAFYSDELIAEANDFDREAIRQQARDLKL